ncbi:protein jag [Clostridiaceae bacterium OttesenSCG-928-D20]|nr:protein jag [Clostridiaceae bacterium OttesenSCG-928-D20]
MQKYIEVSAKTEEQAVAQALQQLGLERDDVSVEIIERSKAGFLGLGGQDAKIRVSYESSEADAPKKPAAPAASAVKAEPVINIATGEKPEQIKSFLNGLLEHMNIKAEIIISDRERGGYNATLSGEHMGAVIGRRGETLDAIQHLCNYSVNRGTEKRVHINVDAENYRKKREDALISLAEKIAQKVIKYRRSMALEPMNSYERHVIHTALSEYEGVTTKSAGVEPNRRVVVSYASTAAEEIKPKSREWA